MLAPQSQAAVGGEPLTAAEFDALYRRRVGLVLRYLRRRGVAAGWDDDCAHEVFMTAARKWASRNTAVPEAAWLCAIARRVASNHRRRNDRAARNVAEVPESSSAVSPHRQAEVREDLEFVEQFVANLPEKYREVFVLCEIERCSCVDVAQICELPVNTVYTRLARARQRLNRAMERREHR